MPGRNQRALHGRAGAVSLVDRSGEFGGATPAGVPGFECTEIGELALARKVRRLAEVVVTYRAAIDGCPGMLEFATVQESRDRDHAYLLEIVSMILGKYHDSDNPDHLAARTLLLEPIATQGEQVRELRRRGRGNPELPMADGDPGVAQGTSDFTTSETADSKSPAIS